LRDRLPNTHILLLGLTPRSDRFHDKVIAVNKLISACGGREVTYADIGDKMLDKNKDLSSGGILLDGVHFSVRGYDLLTKQLIPVIDNLSWGRSGRAP
jgi:lysophospholipase L1-like esterase